MTKWGVGRGLKWAVAGVLMMLASAAAHAERAGGPAVASPNFKFGVQGGTSGNQADFLGLGSYTVPLGDQLGFQLDGAAGLRDQKFIGGVGAHLFMRDPSAYLVGLYGSAHAWQGINIYRGGIETEAYVGPVTFSALAGVENYHYPATLNNMVVLNQDSTHLFAQGDVSYYATENFMLSAGLHYLNQTPLAAFGVEYKLDRAPVSLFANATLGDNAMNTATVGVHIYTGAAIMKTLRETTRTLDPQNYTPAFPTPTLVNATCGNGVVEPGEQCDQGNNNDNNGACTLSCKLARCGDGFVSPGEICDAGVNNGKPGSHCTATCEGDPSDL